MNQFYISKVGQEHDGEVHELPIGVLAENVETDSSRQFISAAELAELKAKPSTTSPVSDNTVTFTTASTRTNLQSKDTLSTIAGKVSRWFADLGTAAFKGVSNTLGITADGYVLDARAGKELNDKLGGMRFYEDATGKYVVGADSVPKKLGNPYEIRKICLTDSPGEWFVGDTTGYEVINASSCDFGIYAEVYIQTDGITAAKYGTTYESGNPEVWRDGMKPSYNATTGVISVNYGSALYLGGGNACRMTILYRN